MHPMALPKGSIASPGALVSGLLAAQNQDGGWGYASGHSWTEPTVFALLALHAWQAGGDSRGKAAAWLTRVVRPDGGVAPNPSVAQSTWVTALALLARRVTGSGSPEGGFLQWLLRAQSEDSLWWHRVRDFVRGTPSNDTAPAWSWFPGTAGWVFPTACTLAALKYPTAVASSQDLHGRIAQGEQVLQLESLP